MPCKATRELFTREVRYGGEILSPLGVGNYKVKIYIPQWVYLKHW